MTVVVDASVAVKRDLLAPDLLLPEAANALGRRLHHPVDDCVYLALASREGAALVTADQRLLARMARRRTRLAVIDLATL
jgi:predicted nucleic acid-binding protein